MRAEFRLSTLDSSFSAFWDSPPLPYRLRFPPPWNPQPVDRRIAPPRGGALYCWPLAWPRSCSSIRCCWPRASRLLDPDEGLHAAIAQEMVERGDWVVPRLQGKPFLDKPILYFWAEAASLKLFGMSEGAVRLPGLLLGMLGMAATGIVGGRMFGRDAGWLAAIFYASMVLPVALTQAAAHDVALVPWVAFATLLLWEAEQAASPRKALAGTIAAGVFLGLAMLTKGLVGVALVAAALRRLLAR